MKNLKIITLLIAIVGFTSCKKYLSEEPRVQADIKTVDQLQALIDDSYDLSTAGPQFADNGRQYWELSTDDYEIPTALYQARPATFNATVISNYVFDVNSIMNLTTDFFWAGQYNKIFTANVILSNVDNVTGSDQDKARVKGNAYFLRAYAYWLLVNAYCQPYSAANLSGLGLPLKKTTSFEEPLVRSTLQETYDFILSDINQAQALITTDDVSPTLRWRASKAAIDAFLSRYYLFTGDYTKCIQYANSALARPNTQLVDYNTINVGNTVNYTNPTASLVYSELQSWSYTNATIKVLNWQEFYYPKLQNFASQNYIPSAALIALYDQSNDLRFKWFMIPNGERRFSITNYPSAYRYVVFNDGVWYPQGPTIAEVLLNKAEAAARTNDLATALGAINSLRAKRYKSGSSYAISFSSQADAVAKILQERRREMPFVTRFEDIRRFSVNNDPSDDVVITRNFYKETGGLVDATTPQSYTLKNSNLIVPINSQEIVDSRGQIQQNTYQ